MNRKQRKAGKMFRRRYGKGQAGIDRAVAGLMWRSLTDAQRSQINEAMWGQFRGLTTMPKPRELDEQSRG